MSIFPPNLLLINMTPGSTSVAGNVWPTNENTSRQLVDDFFTGVNPIVMSGAATVLQITAGQSSPGRQRFYPVTGTISSAATPLLMPPGVASAFSVYNNTSAGSTFPLTVGVSNGAFAAAGATVSINRGQIAALLNDGTNIYFDSRPGATWSQRVKNQTTTQTAFPSSTPSAYLSQSFTPQFAGSTITIRATLSHESTWVSGNSASCAVMDASIRRNGIRLYGVQGGGSADMQGVTGIALAPNQSLPMVFQESSPGAGVAVTYAIFCADARASGLTNNALNASILIEETF